MRVAPFVDGIGVLLWLLRNPLADIRTELGLTPVRVFEDLPDRLSDYVPVVKVQRTGGASDAPLFYSQFWCSVNVWSGPEVSKNWDAHQAAFELANQVARTLYFAQRNQTLTPSGSISKWRESTGFRKFDDPELPHISRQVATYDLLIRNPRIPA
jgi:hypothetical protein